jgi:hypothetical protein
VSSLLIRVVLLLGTVVEDISVNGNFFYKRKTSALFVELCLYFPDPSGLSLKIIHMPKKYILGYHVPELLYMEAILFEMGCDQLRLHSKRLSG